MAPVTKVTPATVRAVVVTLRPDMAAGTKEWSSSGLELRRWRVRALLLDHELTAPQS
jgi:hypothetical protein